MQMRLGKVHAFGTSRPPEPATDATADDRIGYLTKYVESLSDELVATRTHANKLVQDSEQRTGERVAALSSRLDQTDARVSSVRQAVTGPNGVGLRRAALGLAMALVGVLLTLVGLNW